jgi:hypothetical protein
MFARPMLSWTCLTEVQVPWTWRMAKSKYFRFDITVRPVLPWTWLNVKSKCRRSNIFVRPSPNTLGLACSQNPYYLRLDGWTSLSTLGLAWLSYSCYFGLNWLVSPSVMDLVDCQVQVPWVWHVYQIQIILFYWVCSWEDVYSLRCAKGEWSFPWAWEEMIVIPLDMPRKDGRYLGLG